MNDISDAADLLGTARGALLNELLPTLSKEQRYIGLMIANAMAIAVREQASSPDVARSEIGRLRHLLGAVNGDDAERELPALRRTLCAAIRAGAFDDAARASAVTALSLIHI